MIDESAPFLLLRARVRPDARTGFDRWFRETHLRDVARIPGIAGVQSGSTAGGARLGFYSFAGAGVVQSAMGSPEAAYVRGAWAPWAAELEELSIEIFAPLLSIPAYRVLS